MTERATEERIRELTRELEPVKPIPPLRTVGALLVATGVVVYGIDYLARGFGPRHADDVVWTTPSFLAALFGVGLVAFGASAAALASAVPGRADTMRIGLRVTAGGFALALAGWVFGTLVGAGDHSAEGAGDMLACGTRVLLLGIAPVLVLCGFIARAAMRRAAMAAALALAGGVALGAVTVHASCASNSPLHQLLAHSLAPAAAVVALTAPLALLMGRWARRG